MSKELKRIQQRARELAGSGKFFGARAVAFELQFEFWLLTRHAMDQQPRGAGPGA